MVLTTQDRLAKLNNTNNQREAMKEQIAWTILAHHILHLLQVEVVVWVAEAWEVVLAEVAQEEALVVEEEDN